MISLIPDTLSSAARDLVKAASTNGYQSLTSNGHGDAAVILKLRALDASTLLVRPAKDIASAQCAVAAMWVWYDFLDQPHEITQQVHDPMGSYWHGIIHRREREFSNAKYWFARAGAFPLHDTLAVRADDLLRTLPADKSLFRLTADSWNASAFVDLVAAITGHPDDPRTAVAILLQQLEWQVLFEHCVRTASA